jgi:hypothetical protein
MMTSLVALACFIFIFVFAQSLTMLVIAEVFCGIPWVSRCFPPKFATEPDLC